MQLIEMHGYLFLALVLQFGNALNQSQRRYFYGL